MGQKNEPFSNQPRQPWVAIPSQEFDWICCHSCPIWSSQLCFCLFFSSLSFFLSLSLFPFGGVICKARSEEPYYIGSQGLCMYTIRVSMIARSRRKKQEREEGCCLRKKRKGEEKKKKRKKSISIVSVTPMRICHIQHTMRYIHTYSTYVGPISYRGTYCVYNHNLWLLGGTPVWGDYSHAHTYLSMIQQ